jgi:hypothetical protein
MNERPLYLYFFSFGSDLIRLARLNLVELRGDLLEIHACDR